MDRRGGQESEGPMDLQVFVREALVQVTRGVVEADEALREVGGLVNPHGVYLTNAPGAQQPFVSWDPQGAGRHRLAQVVEFDIAVYVSEEQAKGAGGGLKISILHAGGHAEVGTASGSESRLRFSVPLVMPPSKNAKS